MKDYDKKNLKRLACLFSAVLILFFALVTAKVSFNWWWASLPTSGIAIAAAVLLFKRGYIDPDREE